MTQRSPDTQAEARASERGKNIFDFLVRELPPTKTKQAPYLTEALLHAGTRYDRLTARKHEWWRFGTRAALLKDVSEGATRLAKSLSKIDIVTRDDLEGRMGPEKLEAIFGSLHLLWKETTELAMQVQRSGKPRDLAEERWIIELADIYENAFGKRAAVGGSGGKTAKPRGKFSRLLELGRPTSYPRYGKLNPRQVDRILKRRKADESSFKFRRWASLARE